MKAATTSLAKTLGNSNEISTGDVKEFDYFIPSKFERTPIEKYHNNFDAKCSIWGECAPNYGKRDSFTGVAQRIHDYNPNAKIIFIRRNPIERSLSELKMYWEEGEISQDSKIHWHKNRRSKNWKRKNLKQNYEVRFGDFESNPIIQNSRYEYQLHPYRELFGESLLILDFEKLTNSSGSDQLTQLLQHIGASPTEEIHSQHTHKSANMLIPSNLALFLAERFKYFQTDKLIHQIPALRSFFLRIGYLRKVKKVQFSSSLLSDLESFFSDPSNK